MSRLPDDDSTELRPLVVGLAHRLEDVNRRADGAERVTELVPEHRHELVLGAIGVLDSLEIERQNLLVHAPQTFAHLEQDVEFDVPLGRGEVSELIAFDLEDDTFAASPYCGRSRLLLEQAHLAEDFSARHDGKDECFTAAGQYSFGGA